MYAARLGRPTPYVDKTVYTSWNALCISAYLDAAQVLDLEGAKRSALRALDRILNASWDRERGLQHVVAYSDAKAEHREVPGMLDDYAFTAVACLDAFEATADLRYFDLAREILDAMVQRFFDAAGGGFFDTAISSGEKNALGVLGTSRKPFQDSPTPAGNSVAAIALVRLHHYANDAGYREKAEQTLELISGLAGQYGIFASTYAIAAVHFSAPHTQVVVIGDDDAANKLHKTALSYFRYGKSVVRLSAGQVASSSLPPALAETIPNVPAVKEGNSVAVVCSGFSCGPPVRDAEELSRVLARA